MDDLTRIPLITRLREGRSDGTDLRWTVWPIHVEAADRIAELEADRDGLREALALLASNLTHDIAPVFDAAETFRIKQFNFIRQALGAKP